MRRADFRVSATFKKEARRASEDLNRAPAGESLLTLTVIERIVPKLQARVPLSRGHEAHLASLSSSICSPSTPFLVAFCPVVRLLVPFRSMLKQFGVQGEPDSDRNCRLWSGSAPDDFNASTLKAIPMKLEPIGRAGALHKRK